MNDLEGPQFAELLRKLTPKQLEYVEKRLFTDKDIDAAKAIGVAPGSVSRWKSDGAPIDEILRLARQDGVEVARERLRRLSSKAVQVIEEEMDKQRNNRRLEAALAVLDRVGLVKGESLDVTSGGEPLTFRVVYDEADGDN